MRDKLKSRLDFIGYIARNGLRSWLVRPFSIAYIDEEGFWIGHASLYIRYIKKYWKMARNIPGSKINFLFRDHLIIGFSWPAKEKI